MGSSWPSRDSPSTLNAVPTSCGSPPPIMWGHLLFFRAKCLIHSFVQQIITEVLMLGTVPISEQHKLSALLELITVGKRQMIMNQYE